MKYCCPMLDCLCPYYEQGFCTLENAFDECDAFFGLETEDFIEDEED